MRLKRSILPESGWIRDAIVAKHRLAMAHCVAMQEQVERRIQRIALRLEQLPFPENSTEQLLRTELLQKFEMLRLGLDRFWRATLQKGFCHAFHEDLEDRLQRLRDSGTVVRICYDQPLKWDGMHLLPFLLDQVWNCLLDNQRPEWLRLEIDFKEPVLTIQLRYRYPMNNGPSQPDHLCGRDIHFLFSALGARIINRQAFTGSREWTARFIWNDLCAYSSLILAPSTVLD